LLPIIIAISVVAGIGVVAGALLTTASKVMHVPVDETAEKLRECLPGANCGACGYAGCDGYAAALAGKSESATNLCVPGGDTVSREISAILDLPVLDVVEQVAAVHCRGRVGTVRQKMTYQGINTCRAAKLSYSGEYSCADGCLGYGDCAAVCPNNAICVADGVARVMHERCTGCGMCARTCPNGIIHLHADTITCIIDCSNHSRGADVVKTCTAGCIGCRKCERECPVDAIIIKENLPFIDYEKCVGCGHCKSVCVRKCIRFADFRGELTRSY
jgi:RnfABCDGE-type electron transport complex B subunit